MLRFLVAFFLLISVVVNAQLLDHRAWQFHDYNWDYISKAIPMAARAGMNRIQLSHNIIMDAEELWEREGQEARLKFVRDSVDLAHKNGLKVDIWTHELSGVPKEFMDADGKCVLSPRLWSWVEQKYEKLFDLVPGLDGVVLTFCEVDIPVYDDEKVACEQPQMQRIARLGEVVAGVCERNGAAIIIRTFVHEPQQLAWIGEAVQVLGETLKDKKNAVVMTKCVPHDWHPYYPYDPLLGKSAGLPQIVEIDLGDEYSGLSWVPHCQVDYVRRCLKYAREKGVIGAVARVERLKDHALGTPNEVNIHAYSRLVRDSSISNAALWSEWAEAKYGAAAAPGVVRALERTFDINNMTFFPLQAWVMDHSKIGNWEYAKKHVVTYERYSVRRWIPSPYYERIYDDLCMPHWDTLTKIEHEKALARALLAKSEADLDAVRSSLEPKLYAELRDYFDRLGWVLNIFEKYQLALFASMRYDYMLHSQDADKVETERFEAACEKYIKEFDELAKRFVAKYGQDTPLMPKSRIERFSSDVKKIIGHGN